MYLKGRTICEHNIYKSLCADCKRCRHGSYKKQCKYCIGITNDREICCWLNPRKKNMRNKIKIKNKAILKKIKLHNKLKQIENFIV